MGAFFAVATIIFIAEIGDKSQLMALTFAARFKTLPVVVAITVATALIHGISVALGNAVGSAIPTKPATLLAGFAFIGFGFWTLAEDQSDVESVTGSKSIQARHVVVAVGAAFFLAELGDKTMLSTVALAASRNAIPTWAGATVGMVTADVLAITIGRRLGSRLPERTLQIGSATAFFLIGAILILSTLLG